MWRYIDVIAKDWGYKGADHFIDSTFHPDIATETSMISAAFAVIACYFENLFGFQLPVGMVIFILFLVELRTGILASRKDGEGWSSEKFQKGWLKFGVYWILIGCFHILNNYLKAPSILGYNLDIYAFIYFSWLNFVIINLVGSNIENFIRLGWDKNSLLVRMLARIYNIKIKEND